MATFGSVAFPLSGPVPPPTLLKMDASLLVEGPPEVASAAAAAAAKRVAVRGAEAPLEDIINSILPPRMWTQKDATTWMQYISKEPSSRLDVLGLQEALDERLSQRQARLSGVCPVREDLYRQCFDELIRQVAINSPERGLLLLRVRDEIRMTLDAYKTLYDSSVTFGIRKEMQAEEGIPEMAADISELSERKKSLEATILALRNKIEVIERRQVERRMLDEKRRQEELAYLRHQAKHLDLFLKSMPKV